MVHTHASTPARRAELASYLLAHEGEYGVVTAVSRTLEVSRQTLYTWKERGRQALERAFAPAVPEPAVPAGLERAILTLLVEGHASARGIQACLATCGYGAVRLETIGDVLHDAERRALAAETLLPATARAVALDEIYGNDRQGAYLHVVDTASYAVWVAEGPLPVDSDTWTLVLWAAQERGLRWRQTISDGGAAIHAACRAVDPLGRHGRDVWHILRTGAQIQGRLDRQVAALRQQSATVARQAARVAAGQRPRGPHPLTDVVAHAATLALAQRTAEDVRYLRQELRRLVAVVVRDHRGVLDGASRQQEVEALLALLAEVHASAPPLQQPLIERLGVQVRDALPALLLFTPALDRVQHDMGALLGAAGLDLVAWAWQRRAVLGPRPDALLGGLPAAWRPAARLLFTAWADAVRASSAVETWHSILRPHLAVHRTLTRGRLAVLACWHNHRPFTRGVHKGQSPLHLSGIADAPTDWLVALGYPSPEAATSPTPLSPRPAHRRLAA